MTTAPPTDDRFEERILHAILEDFNEITATAARPSAPVRSRRTMAVRRLAPALIAGAAAVAVVVATVPGGAHRAPLSAANPNQATTHLEAHTVSYVLAHVKAATSDANGPFVVVETGHGPDSESGAVVYTKTWFIPGGTTSRDEIDDSAGNPISATVSTTLPDGSNQVVSIDYATKTWSETTYSPPAQGGPAPLPQTPAQNANRLRDSLKAGTTTMVGPATVDGQNTIELLSGSVASGQQFTWVDSSSYLPVREIDTAPGESVSSPSAIQSDDVWLPATAANRQLVTADAAIPAGFTRTN